jgi:multidrug transporter EmrE-like cation transporter
MKITTIVLLCLLSACFQVMGTSLIKTAITKTPIASVKDYIPFLLQLNVILALGFVFIAALVMFKALSFGSISLVTPIFTAINFVFTLAVGRFVFDEPIGWVKLTGISVIVIGVFLVANSEKIN